MANYDSIVSNSRAIVDHTLQTFNSVDILINNAGILRDKSFGKTSAEDWQQVLDVHLHGTHGLCREAWAHMMEKKYGRIVNIGSGAGLYGNFGQASYSAAKMGILGLTQTLAQEGAKHNIMANVVVPIAESKMTATVLPAQMLAMLHPEHIAPLVAYLSHDSCTASGKTFECGGGWYSEVRWQRSGGKALGRRGAPASAETIGSSMAEIQDYSLDRATYPAAPADALRDMLAAASAVDDPVPAAKQPAAQAAVADVFAAPSSLEPLHTDAVFSALSNHLQTQTADILSRVGARTVQFCISGRKVWVMDCSDTAAPSLTSYASLKQANEARLGRPAVSVTISVTDENFMNLCSGSLSAEWAYATGKMQVDGSMGVALKMKGLLELAGELGKK